MFYELGFGFMYYEMLLWFLHMLLTINNVLDKYVNLFYAGQEQGFFFVGMNVKFSQPNTFYIKLMEWEVFMNERKWIRNSKVHKLLKQKDQFCFNLNFHCAPVFYFNLNFIENKNTLL